MNTIPERFCNTNGMVRWIVRDGQRVLQQLRYANYGKEHQFLEYPETEWFDVPVEDDRDNKCSS